MLVFHKFPHLVNQKIAHLGVWWLGKEPQMKIPPIFFLKPSLMWPYHWPWWLSPGPEWTTRQTKDIQTSQPTQHLRLRARIMIDVCAGDDEYYPLLEMLKYVNLFSYRAKKSSS